MGKPVICTVLVVFLSLCSAVALASFNQSSTAVLGYSVSLVEIYPPFTVDVALAGNRLGPVESLAALARANNAVAAINGTYFNAYTDNEPLNTVMRNGGVLHIGDVGSTVAITRAGKLLCLPSKFKVRGGTKYSYEWPNNWYAYGLNHIPAASGNSVYVFTPARGKSLGFAYGTNVIVRNCRITAIVENQDVEIPKDGFVINLCGSEKYLLDRLTVGKPCDYQVETEPPQPEWNDVVCAVGAGPTLIRNGQIVVDAAAEGFTEAKIISNSAARSAIGQKADSGILLVVTAATVRDLARIMQALGCVNALNLDGGASSGLWFKGGYIREPGRLISNALVFR